MAAHDLRMPLLGVVAWSACLLIGWPGAPLSPWLLLAGGAGVALAGWYALDRGPRSAALLMAGLAVAVTAGLVTDLRAEAVARSPTAELASAGAAVEIVGTVSSDARPVAGAYAERIAVRLRTDTVTGRGRRHDVGGTVLVLGGTAWERLELGVTVRATGRLVSADDAELAGILLAGDDVTITAPADVWWRASGAVRAGIRDAVAHRPPEQAALVPALVDGDDAGLSPSLEADFRTAGLTHLTAVSGANLTLVVGFALWLARAVGVRGRWLVVVAALGIAGFVLVARTEPSVLRAAAMGTVGLLALGVDGRRRALAALGVAVVVLLLLDPGLARSAGFALSTLATAGIAVLAPPWSEAMTRWLPRWLAEAVAVPAAAQLACTPVVAALSGQVSVVAVLANLLAAPAVGPTTVLGLAAGLLTLVWEPAGAFVGTFAAWCVAWIIWVARTSAALPYAAFDWGTTATALVLLVACCAGLALGGRALLARPGLIALVVGVLVLVLVVPWPGGGPPDDWVVVACDVGQGDALAVRAGPAAAIVVDTGPDPEPVDRCLGDLGVEQVPLLVLTHFHADHVDGLDGVLRGREVGAAWVSPVLDPDDGAERALTTLEDRGIPVLLPPDDDVTVGAVTLRRLWPPPGPARAGPGDGSAANDASLVLLAEVAGLRILLTGDIEPHAQAGVAAAAPGLDVDVLKVPHHGSAYQQLDWLTSLDAEIALVSVGEDNDYGHPASSVLTALENAGTAVARTDEGGTQVVAVRNGEPELSP